MKISGARQDSFIAKPDPAVACVLLYGPDRGLVGERARILAKTVVEDTSDPFRVVELTGPEIKADPARLSDEAGAIALGGGRRLVRILGATDATSAIFKEHLNNVIGDALVVIEAGELTPRSSLRKLFEGSDNAAAVPCYVDDRRSLHRIIGETLRGHGLTVSDEATAWMADNLGSDRAVTRGELEKLALYMGDEKRIELDDARAVIGDSAASALDDISMAAATGDQTRLDVALGRAFGDGVHAVGVLRATARHMLRLHQCAGLVASGKNVKQAMKSLRPPVFFAHENAFAGQLNRWRTDRLAAALDLLSHAEIDCKTTGMPTEAVCGRVLMRIAQMGRR
ncbi:MAG: DNA polymerase III subunit delta [Alphaproteobacteria bacterium]